MAENLDSFRAGWLDCRETMARFVEPSDRVIAASIRANWNPELGADPASQGSAMAGVHPTDEDVARLAGRIASTAKVIQKIRGCSEREAVQRAIEAMEPYEPPQCCGNADDVELRCKGCPGEAPR